MKLKDDLDLKRRLFFKLLKNSPEICVSGEFEWLSATFIANSEAVLLFGSKEKEASNQ
ncbi:TPA: hypothetical protein ACQUIC_000383 [Streptococcus mutans]